MAARVIMISKILSDFSEKCVAAKSILGYTTNPAADGDHEFEPLKSNLKKRTQIRTMSKRVDL